MHINIVEVIAKFEQEIKERQEAIATLRKIAPLLDTVASTPLLAKAPKRKWTNAQRNAAAKRAKAYWNARKRQGKAKVRRIAPKMKAGRS